MQFEVVVSIRKPQKILWVIGPWKGAVSDITIAREKLIPSMRGSELILGDKGYVGESDKIMTPKVGRERDLSDEDRIFNARHFRVRQLVERVFPRIKGWKSMSSTWRHDLELVGNAFHVICAITNYQFGHGEPLTR